MAFDQFINFRSTAGFVTDAAKTHHQTAVTFDYPATPSAGDSTAVGWESGTGGETPDSRDRNASNDARLAGWHAGAAGGRTLTYRIALPSAGDYAIRVAMGDNNGACSYLKIEVFDDVTSRGVLINGLSTSAANSFRDAAGAEYTAANWPGSNSAVTKTFASSICRFVITDDGSATSRIAHFGITAVASGPTITSVSTATPREGASLTITGTAFGASQGSGDVKINGITQTVTAWADTSITVTVVLGTNKFGAAYTVVVRDNALTASNTYAGITGLLPANSGLSYVDIGTPNTTADYRITAVGDLASGDQLEYENAGGAVSVASDGTFTVGPGISSFSCRLWSTGVGYGTSGLQSIGGLPGDRRYLKLSPNIKLGW